MQNRNNAAAFSQPKVWGWDLFFSCSSRTALSPSSSLSFVSSADSDPRGAGVVAVPLLPQVGHCTGQGGAPGTALTPTVAVVAGLICYPFDTVRRRLMVQVEEGGERARYIGLVGMERRLDSLPWVVLLHKSFKMQFSVSDLKK